MPKVHKRKSPLSKTPSLPPPSGKISLHPLNNRNFTNGKVGTHSAEHSSDGDAGARKTTTCSLSLDAADLRHVNVGDLLQTKGLHDGFDEEFDCYIINEDLVEFVFIFHFAHLVDELEDMMEGGGAIVDYHGSDFFFERWFDRVVVVLQTDNSILHDRLTSSDKYRGYMGARLTNNIECEIFQVLLDEAKASYSEDIVVTMQNNTDEDISRSGNTRKNNFDCYYHDGEEFVCLIQMACCGLLYVYKRAGVIPIKEMKSSCVS